MTLEVSDPTAFMLAISAAQGVPLESEALVVRLDGEAVATRELGDLHGTRLQLFEPPPGFIEIDSRPSVAGRAEPAPAAPLAAIPSLRPSRYVQSDTLQPFARRTFPGLEG